MKASKRPKPRAHLPALNPLELEGFASRLGALKISQVAITSVMDSMNSAANAQAETPAVVIESLGPDLRDRVKQAMPDYQRTLSGMNNRGKLALMQMSDGEWNSLLDKAAGDK